LRGNSEDFLKMAQSSLEKQQVIGRSELDKKQLELEKTLQPFQILLDQYRKELKEIESERRNSYQKVENELKKVVEINSELAGETSALKNALKRPHVRGRWGEMQLKNCVELSGMSEFSDVTFQDSQVNAEGDRLIPDLTVRMPGGRVIVVDAKTPIDAFMSSLESTDEVARHAEQVRHGKHVKEHVRKLATRAYAEGISDSADFVVMFLPNESFLYAALETEPDLVEFALQKKVLIATPPTLIGLLKVIRFGWNEERLAENATRISEAGQELHRRLCDLSKPLQILVST
jgi:DNA recombination protein RmuC